MQNIKNFWRADPEISALRTNERTDEAEFIGPFPLKPWVQKEEKKHNKKKFCKICEKKFSTNDNNKKYHKVKDHCHYSGKYRGASHDICNLRYKITKEIPVVFHNGSTYDYHFIIKELAEEFEGEFECLGENT